MQDGGEGDLGGFAAGLEALAAGFEVRVVQWGAKRGHVEGFARGGPATADVALSSYRAAVGVCGGDPSECGDGPARQPAKLRQVS